MIVGIYDGDPRLTNDHKSSRRVGKAWKWLGRVGKCSERFVHRSRVSEYTSRARGSSSAVVQIIRELKKQSKNWFLQPINYLDNQWPTPFGPISDPSVSEVFYLTK